MSETTTTNDEADAVAPGELELVRALVNSRELDPDRESVPDTAALDAWLERWQIPASGPVDSDDVARFQEFREAVRALLFERDHGGVDPATIKRLRAVAEEPSLRMDVDGGGSVSVVPTCGGADAAIARVLAVIAAAQETGEWDRLKVCYSDECLWAFYDRSRNRSRHWCSMDVCGNRAKTRTYRAKR